MGAGGGAGSNPDPFAVLAASRYVSLTTFRKDGTPVATPVWVVALEGELWVWTNPGAGKVKRLRRSARAAIAPCRMRGEPLGKSCRPAAGWCRPIRWSGYGAIQLAGDPDGAAGLLNHLLVELAHQSWSDGVSLALVGWGQNLVTLNPDRITHLADMATAAVSSRSPGRSRISGSMCRRPAPMTSPPIPGNSWCSWSTLTTRSTLSTSSS